MPELTNITIPTPEPYSKNDQSRNQEGYYYVYLQLLQAAKDAGESVSFNPAASDLSTVVEALHALQFNGERIDLGDVAIILTGKTTTIEQS